MKPDTARDRGLFALALVAVAAAPVTEAIRIVAGRGAIVLYGDQALLELGARRAWHLDQLVGPYSRDGFHHPGPAVYYLLAPFVRLLSTPGRGLYLGAIVLNGAALIAVVAAVRRLAGPAAAIAAALVLDVYALRLPVATLREPWNPYLVLVPMILLAVLAASALTRPERPVVWSLVVGSYLIQTEVATVVPVVTLLGLVALSRAVRRRRATTRSGRRANARRRRSIRSIRWSAASIGWTVLAASWAPPVVELWRDHPDNVQRMWRALSTATSSGVSGHSLATMADALTVLPFGYHDYVVTSTRSSAALSVGTGLMLVALAGAVAFGWRRGQPAALALAAAAVAILLAGGSSLIAAPAPLYLYFSLFLSAVPVLLAIAVAVALVGPAAGRPGLPVRVWAIGSVVAGLAVVMLVTDLGTPDVAATTGAGPWPDAIAGTTAARAEAPGLTLRLVRASERILRPADRAVEIVIGAPGLWPYAAGLVLGLDERNVAATVSPRSWTAYFGAERAPGRSVDGILTLEPGSTVPAATGAVIAKVPGAVLAYRPVG